MAIDWDKIEKKAKAADSKATGQRVQTRQEDNLRNPPASKESGSPLPNRRTANSRGQTRKYLTPDTKELRPRNVGTATRLDPGAKNVETIAQGKKENSLVPEPPKDKMYFGMPVEGAKSVPIDDMLQGTAPIDVLLARGIQLAGIDSRPLTETERQEAKAIGEGLEKEAVELRGGFWATGTAADKRKANNYSSIAAILNNKTSTAGAFMGGVIEAIPFAERTVDAAQQNTSKVIADNPDAYGYTDDVADVLVRNKPVQDMQGANPTAKAIGSGGMTLGLLLGTSGAITAGTKGLKWFSKLFPWVQNAINSGLTFGGLRGLDAADEVQTKAQWDEAEFEKRQAAAAAGADYVPQEYSAWGQVTNVLKEIGIGFAGGAAGSTASSLVGNLGKHILIKNSLQTPFAEAIRQTVSGTAFAAANTGATYYMYPEEYRPSKEQIVGDLAVAFLFSAITSSISTYKTTKANKSSIEKAVGEMQREYEKTFAGNRTAAERQAAYDKVLEYNKLIRKAISQNYFAGGQSQINDVLTVLDALDEQILLIKQNTNFGTGVPLIGNAGVGAPTPGAGAAAPIMLPNVGAQGTKPTGTPVSGGMAATAISDAASTFGESGGKAFVAVLDETMPMDKYYGEFAKIYNEGMEGKALEAVSSEVLAPAQTYAAWTAGKNDAKPTVKNDSVGVVSKIKAAIPMLKNLPMAASVTGAEMPDIDMKPTDRVMSLLNSINNMVTRPGFGDVFFSRSKIKSSLLGHGFGKAKIEVFAAVPNVIQTGMQIDFAENWNGKGYDTYLFAAPIDYRGNPSYLGVLVAKDAASGRYYLHEVIDENGNVIYNEEAPTDASDGRADIAVSNDTVASDGAPDNIIPKSGAKSNSENAIVGRQKTEYSSNNKTNMEVKNDEQRGKEGLSKSGGWTSGVDTREQGGRLAERTGRPETRRPGGTQAAKAAGTRADAQAKGITEVSSAEVGISSGTDKPSVRILPANFSTETAVIHRQAAEDGVEVVCVAGDLQVNYGGTVRSANGVHERNKIFVSMTDERFSGQQLYKHELIHDRIERERAASEDNRSPTFERVKSEFLSGNDGELQALLDVYSVRYYSNDGSLSIDVILEEIICDAAAGIDIFEGSDTMEGATRYSGTVNEAFGESVQKNSASEGGGVKLSAKEQIKPGMSEAERYDRLKERELSVVSYNAEKVSQIEASNYKALERIGRHSAYKVLVKIGEQFGVFKSDYSTQDVEFEFGFSHGNLRESTNKQKQSFQNYAKMMTVFDDVIKNAIGIETHNERYKNISGQIDKVYIFASAFAADNNIIPVLMEVKTFTDETTATLHVAVSLNEIDRSRIFAYTSADVATNESYTLPASIIKIADLFRNVNPEDGNLLKYIPDGFLTDEQKASKQKALEKTEAYIAKKNEQRYTKNSFQGDSAQKNSDAAQQGGEVKLSVKNVDGRAVVWIDNSPLSNKQLGDHSAVADYIAEHIGDVYTIIESGQGVYIGNDLPGEYTHSKYTSYLRDRNRKLLKAKNKVVDDFGLLIETATNRRWEPTKHKQSKDAKYGMYRYDTSFAFPVSDRNGNIVDVHAYDAELLIRNASDGKKYLYDIININENTANALDLLQKETRKGSHKAAARGDAIDSIRQDNEKSNSKNSLTTETELEKQIAKLTAQNERLREQLNTTEGVKTDRAGVSGLARAIVKEYSSSADTKAFGNGLLELYDYIANGTGETLSWDEVKGRAVKLAREVLNSSGVLNDDMYKQYRDLRGRLRGLTIQINRSDARDIADFNDFRKSQFGRFNLSYDKGTPIDVLYQELSQSYSEFFDETQVNAPSDQLLSIADVLDGLQPTYENPFSYDMRCASEFLANEIIDSFYDVPQQSPTYADRMTAKVDEAKSKGHKDVTELRAAKNDKISDLKERNRNDIQWLLMREKAKREGQVSALKEHFQSKEAKSRENLRARELRKKIEKHTKSLSEKLLKPSDKKHIPEALRSPVAAVLDSINRESLYTLDANGKRVKGGNGQPVKRTQQWEKLREAYKQAQKTEYMVLDPDLLGSETAQGYVDDLIGMADKSIAAMNSEELTVVWRALRAMEASVSNMDKMLGKSRFATVSEVAELLKFELQKQKTKPVYWGGRGGIDAFLSIEMLKPVDYFHRLGTAGTTLWREMRGAQDKHIQLIHQAQEAMQGIIGKTKISKWNGNDAPVTEFVTESGDRISLTPSQVMELYLLMKRPQAEKHLLQGGIQQREIRLRGGKSVQNSAPIFVTHTDLYNIVHSLTIEQVEMADRLGEYVSTALADWGNEASMAVYGYNKFSEAHYWPIKSVPSRTVQQVSGKGQDVTVKNRGMAKQTVDWANNAVLISDVFDTFAQHTNDMATYSAWLAVIEDVERIRNYKFRNAGLVVGSVDESLSRVMGSAGPKYLKLLVEDINQGVKTKSDGFSTDKFTANYKAAAVGANLRVIVQQPTAYLRAAAVINPKYLAKGVATKPEKGRFELIKKWAPIAQWKGWGYFELDNGRLMKDVLLGTDSKLDKARQLAMKPAGWADSITWVAIWNACEVETTDTTNLKNGSDEYYEAVAARFNEVIDQTQVVDGVLQRNQVMRSSNALTRMATSFMAEPITGYSMLISAAYDATQSSDEQVRQQAKKRLVRVAIAVLVADVICAAVASFIDAMRDDNKKKDYWEKWAEAFLGISGDEENFLDYVKSIFSGNLAGQVNLLGKIPFAKDFVSLFAGYDITRMDMDAVSRLIRAGQTLLKALDGGGKQTLGNAFANFFASLATCVGLPVSNLKRDILGAVDTVLSSTGNWILVYEVGKILYSTSGNGAYFYDILFRAYKDDLGQYKELYEAMVRDGFSENKLDNAIRTRVKQSEEFATASWNMREPLEIKLTQNNQYLSLPEEYKTVAQDYLSQYIVTKTMLEQNSDYTLPDTLNWIEKADAGADVGLDTTEYTMFKVACDMANEDGSFKQEEFISMLNEMDLTDEEKDYLFGTKYKSDKNNPFIS